MGVDSTTYLADAKVVYGAVQDQVSTLPAFMNLLGDGSKFGKPVNNLGIRGYTFLARLLPNWNMGYRPESYTGVGNNVANFGNQGMANSTVTLKYAYCPVIVTGQAENLTKGEGRAFMQAKAMEAKFDMKDIVSHVNVVMVGAERGGQLAQVGATPAPTTTSFYADPGTNGSLPGAIYLRVGMPLDSGPVGGGALSMAGGTITGINYATGIITFATAAGTQTPTAGHAVYLSGEAPQSTQTFPYTAEGIISLVSSTGARQGLDPAQPGQTPWAAYMENMAGADISPSSILRGKQFVKNRSGAEVNLHITSSAQINSIVRIATNVMQFQTQNGGVGKKALDLGFETYSYGGNAIVEEKDFRPDKFVSMDPEMYKKFEALPLSMAEDEAGSWTRVTGANGIADAVQGLMRWYHQLGTLQRNAGGMQYNHSVPAAFQGTPATL